MRLRIFCCFVALCFIIPLNVMGASSVVTRLQNAINTSDTLLLKGKYRLDETIRITKPIVIRGKACLVFNKNNEVGISIESSNVTIAGLTVKTKSTQSNVIQAKGTGEKPLCDLRIENCTVRGGKNAIYWDYVDDAIITSNKIRSVGYAGIALHSCHRIDVTFNHIKDINLDHSYQNSYGVAATSHYGRPKSTDIRINDNTVENNPYWEALDTHGGERIEFCRNVVRNCWRGVAAVSNNHNGVIMLCRDVLISNNDIECSDEPYSNGIAFASEDAEHLSFEWKVNDNIIRNAVIGIYSTYSSGATVTNNDIAALDEGWQDWGSRNISFVGNKIELAAKAKGNYEKCGIFLIPKGKANGAFGEIKNNIINSGVSEGIKMRNSFTYSIEQSGNQIDESNHKR